MTTVMMLCKFPEAKTGSFLIKLTQKTIQPIYCGGNIKEQRQNKILFLNTRSLHHLPNVFLTKPELLYLFELLKKLFTGCRLKATAIWNCLPNEIKEKQPYSGTDGQKIVSPSHGIKFVNGQEEIFIIRKKAKRTIFLVDD